MWVQRSPLARQPTTRQSLHRPVVGGGFDGPGSAQQDPDQRSDNGEQDEDQYVDDRHKQRDERAAAGRPSDPTRQPGEPVPGICSVSHR